MDNEPSLTDPFLRLLQTRRYYPTSWTLKALRRGKPIFSETNSLTTLNITSDSQIVNNSTVHELP